MLPNVLLKNTFSHMDWFSSMGFFVGIVCLFVCFSLVAIFFYLNSVLFLDERWWVCYLVKIFNMLVPMWSHILFMFSCLYSIWSFKGFVGVFLFLYISLLLLVNILCIWADVNVSALLLFVVDGIDIRVMVYKTTRVVGCSKVNVVIRGS